MAEFRECVIDEEWLAGQLSQLPRPIMAIHAGAGWETKRWPVEKFAEIARRFDGSVVAVGTGSEQMAAARIVDSQQQLNLRSSAIFP